MRKLCNNKLQFIDSINIKKCMNEKKILLKKGNYTFQKVVSSAGFKNTIEFYILDVKDYIIVKQPMTV